MSGRLSILHIAADLEFGGLQRLIVDTARHIDVNRFQTHVLPLGRVSSLAKGLEGFASLHRPEAMPWYSMIWPRSLTRQIATIAPDVVHTHSGVWYKASLAARNARVPRIVHTDHGRLSPDPWQHRLVDGLASRRTDVIIAVSEVLGRQIAATVVANPNRIRVIPNGVDANLYRPLPDTGTLRRELGLSPDVSIIGSIGRLEHIKGYDVMVEAFAHLRHNWGDTPPPVLVIAGDGLDRARLEMMIGSLRIQDAVFILGWREAIQDLHSAFTLFTLASRSEGTSVGLLEAMSAQLCPVVTDVGGNAAVLGPHLKHRLVASQSPLALASAWREALLDVERRTQDAVVARDRVLECYDLAVMVRKYERIYSGLPSLTDQETL